MQEERSYMLFHCNLTLAGSIRLVFKQLPQEPANVIHILHLWEVLHLGIQQLLQSRSSGRAYPDSEFVVAIMKLAKWNKLEPNEISFSQRFSQKVVSSSCFVFNSLSPRGDFCCLLITFTNSLDPDQARQNVGPDLDPNCLAC